MSLSKEFSLTYTTTRSATKITHASRLAGSLAEKLYDGQYLLRPEPRPVFFIRIDDWTPDLDIEILDLVNDYFISLTNNRHIQFDNEHTREVLTGFDNCRVVLLSDAGFTSFLVDI